MAKATTKILLEVPTDIYLQVKKLADKETYESGNKKSISAQMIEQIKISLTKKQK